METGIRSSGAEVRSWRRIEMGLELANASGSRVVRLQA